MTSTDQCFPVYMFAMQGCLTFGSLRTSILMGFTYGTFVLKCETFIVVGTGIVLNCQTVSCDVLIMFLIYPTLAISEAFSMFILGALV